MNLTQCLENLKHDVSNGGIAEGSFAVNCYITMANKAHRLLKNGARDQQEANYAREYLALCHNSGSDVLKCISEGRYA